MPSKKVKKQAKDVKIHAPNANLDTSYPVFCFKHLQTVPQSDYKFFAQFIERLSKLSSLPWKEIDVADRHGFGYEKLPVSQIKPKLPPFVTPDVEKLTVFRANGDNRPFLGIRNENVFHIIFIEENFGEVYNH